MTTSKTVSKKAAATPSKPRSTGGKKTTARSQSATKKPEAEAEPRTAPVKPKEKLIRDSFTIPKSEYLVLEALKVRAANLKRPTKKSELLRAGIAALKGMHDQGFLSALGAVPSLKTGRPKSTERKQAK